MVHGKVDYQVHAQYMYVNTSLLCDNDSYQLEHISSHAGKVINNVERNTSNIALQK